jgi:ribosomal protein S18 acetylase RimI-like enzyme
VHPLDNPVWHALVGPHAKVAEGRGGARRYHPDYAIFAAVPDDADAAAWADLGELAAPEGAFVMLHAPGRPDSWAELGTFPVLQMTWTDPGRAPTTPTGPDRPVALDAGHRDALGDLVVRTEPGPWRTRTFELGSFVGIVRNGTLVAAAGQRMCLADAVEISAVCTDPEWRGRGYGAAVTTEMARRIAATGRTPFLHVRADNDGARRVYERIGFTVRAELPGGAYRAADPGT